MSKQTKITFNQLTEEIAFRILSYYGDPCLSTLTRNFYNAVNSSKLLDLLVQETFKKYKKDHEKICNDYYEYDYYGSSNVQDRYSKDLNEYKNYLIFLKKYPLIAKHKQISIGLLSYFNNISYSELFELALSQKWDQTVENLTSFYVVYDKNGDKIIFESTTLLEGYQVTVTIDWYDVKDKYCQSTVIKTKDYLVVPLFYAHFQPNHKKSLTWHFSDNVKTFKRCFGKGSGFSELFYYDIHVVDSKVKKLDEIKQVLKLYNIPIDASHIEEKDKEVKNQLEGLRLSDNLIMGYYLVHKIYNAISLNRLDIMLYMIDIEYKFDFKYIVTELGTNDFMKMKLQKFNVLTKKIDLGLNQVYLFSIYVSIVENRPGLTRALISHKLFETNKELVFDVVAITHDIDLLASVYLKLEYSKDKISTLLSRVYYSDDITLLIKLLNAGVNVIEPKNYALRIACSNLELKLVERLFEMGATLEGNENCCLTEVVRDKGYQILDRLFPGKQITISPDNKADISNFKQILTFLCDHCEFFTFKKRCLNYKIIVDLLSNGRIDDLIESFDNELELLFYNKEYKEHYSYLVILRELLVSIINNPPVTAQAETDQKVRILAIINKGNQSNNVNDEYYQQIIEEIDVLRQNILKILVNHGLGAKHDGTSVVLQHIAKTIYNLQPFIENGENFEKHCDKMITIACESNDSVYLEYLSFAGVGFKDISDCIKIACRNNNLEIAKLLLSKGGFYNTGGCGFVHAAKYKNCELIALLLEYGIGVSYISPKLAEMACELNSINLISTLLCLGFNTKQRQFNGLDIACKNNNLEIVNFLLKKRVNINYKTFCWFKDAASAGNIQLIQALVDGGVRLSSVKPAFNGLLDAINSNDTEVFKILSTNGADYSCIDKEAIKKVVSNQNIEMLRIIHSDAKHRFPFFSIDYSEVVKTENRELVDALLTYRVKPINCCKSGFYEACVANDTHIAKLILSVDSRLCVHTESYYKVIAKNDNREIIDEILKLSSNDNIDDKYSIILRNICEVNNMCMLEWLLSKELNLRTYKHNGIKEACQNNNLEVVRSLIKHGAKPWNEKHAGIPEAASHGNVEIIELLLEHGAKVENTTYNGLRESLKNNKFDSFEILMNNGAWIPELVSYTRILKKKSLILSFVFENPILTRNITKFVFDRAIKTIAFDKTSNSGGGNTVILDESFILLETFQENRKDIAELLLKCGCSLDGVLNQCIMAAIAHKNRPLLQLIFAYDESLDETIRDELFALL